MTKEKKVTILIADDHEVVRTGLATVIDYEDDLEVVGVAKNGKIAVAQAELLRPDVVIMDLVMPVMNGIEATERIRETLPGTHVLILTSFGTPEDLRSAHAAGADGILMKSTTNHDIIRAVRRLAKGEKIIPRDIAAQISSAEPTVELSERQLEILYAVARGLSNQDIAIRIGVSQGSVKKHLMCIFQKLGAATRAEAVSIALRKGVIRD